ncbi:hypothetical protein [Streptosporangium sandarakinum]|uniref:hypothetical protein n=1 Tax=Streptosporangium sandarakinum TaxID=1260955 RepID=UPI0034212877
MKRMVMGAAAAGLGVGVARWLRSRERGGPARDREAAERWNWVTVNCPPEKVMPEGRLPVPLAELGDAIEVRTREAPGGKGTELGARPRTPAATTGTGGLITRLAGEDPRQPIRKALRDAKSLAETGEVLLPDRPGTDRPTMTGKIFDVVTRRASGEGRL